MTSPDTVSRFIMNLIEMKEVESIEIQKNLTWQLH